MSRRDRSVLPERNGTERNGTREKRCQERVKKCILRSAEWGRWSESTSPSLGGKRPAADLVFDDRLPPYLFRSSPFMSSFSSLSLFPQAVTRAASVRVGRRRKANHLVRL